MLRLKINQPFPGVIRNKEPQKSINNFVFDKNLSEIS